jgi:hypothetical protein
LLKRAIKPKLATKPPLVIACSLKRVSENKVDHESCRGEQDPPGRVRAQKQTRKMPLGITHSLERVSKKTKDHQVLLGEQKTAKRLRTSELETAHSLCLENCCGTQLSMTVREAWWEKHCSLPNCSGRLLRYLSRVRVRQCGRDSALSLSQTVLEDSCGTRSETERKAGRVTQCSFSLPDCSGRLLWYSVRDGEKRREGKTVLSHKLL